jgi:hypothetical protein
LVIVNNSPDNLRSIVTLGRSKKFRYFANFNFFDNPNAIQYLEVSNYRHSCVFNGWVK